MLHKINLISLYIYEGSALTLIDPELRKQWLSDNSSQQWCQSRNHQDKEQ